MFQYHDERTNGLIQLMVGEEMASPASLAHDETTLTIVWNHGVHKELLVDGASHMLATHQVVVFNVNQRVKCTDYGGLVAWKFNREFYCIVDHDQEVSCAGLLFYGGKGTPTISLDAIYQKKIRLLHDVFLDEFKEPDDNLKGEMLRVILKRLIVKITRLYKTQNELDTLENSDLDMVREFNLLVEQHFKTLHQVQDYADLLSKSPKTISNIFSKYSEKSPLQVIHERIVLEVRRLLLYTDKSAKEIAFETGFQDFPGFSRFFKKHAGLSPSQYRKAHTF